MTDRLQSALASAYEMIEADKLEEARALLKPILAEDLDNADAWWLYAHAVDDPEVARTALNNVLRIDRDYPGAAELMETLERIYPTGAPAAEPDLFAENAPVPPDLVDDLDLNEEDFDLDLETDLGEPRIETAPASASTARRSRPAPLFLLLVLAAVLIGIFVVALLTSGAGEQPAPVPTAESGTAVAGEEQQLLSTSEFSAEAVDEQGRSEQFTEGTNGQALAELETAFARELTDVDFVPRSAALRDTELGRTLLVDVCTSAGEGMRAVLSRAISGLSRLAGQIGGAADALGVQLVDCETNVTIRVIAGPLEQAAQYASGALDRESFEASWRALP
ncbi:MAG: hypothetical protein ACUVSX_12950 [Aggregatilineales bacterium]